jgi:hypothetical protein
VSLALGSPGAQANLTAAAGAQLAADIAARGGHLSTGTLGTRWLLQALSLAGRGDVAVALASTTTPPSVGAMVVGTSRAGASVTADDLGVGGALTVLSACFVPELDATVVWYGNPPAEFVDANNITKPMMGHWSMQDEFFSPAGVDE